MTAIRSPESKSSPTLIANLSILPFLGAEMIVSIFMALITASGSPSSTKSPVYFKMSTTRPFMAEPTCPTASASAFSFFTKFAATSEVLSIMSKEFCKPLTSKNTRLVPSSLICPMATNLIFYPRPFFATKLISSPTSIPEKNCGVGR